MCSSFPGLLIGRTAVHSGKDPAFVAYDQFLSTGILQPLSRGEVRCGSIVLQKSQVAGRRIFRENPKQEAIADSYSLTRITKVACEFNPSRIYTKAAPTALRIFDHHCKTTFATQSAISRHSRLTCESVDSYRDAALHWPALRSDFWRM
jgi:hypothetical protein